MSSAPQPLRSATAPPPPDVMDRLLDTLSPPAPSPQPDKPDTTLDCFLETDLFPSDTLHPLTDLSPRAVTSSTAAHPSISTPRAPSSHISLPVVEDLPSVGSQALLQQQQQQQQKQQPASQVPTLTSPIVFPASTPCARPHSMQVYLDGQPHLPELDPDYLPVHGATTTPATPATPPTPTTTTTPIPPSCTQSNTTKPSTGVSHPSQQSDHPIVTSLPSSYPPCKSKPPLDRSMESTPHHSSPNSSQLMTSPQSLPSRADRLSTLTTTSTRPSARTTMPTSQPHLPAKRRSAELELEDKKDELVHSVKIARVDACAGPRHAAYLRAVAEAGAKTDSGGGGAGVPLGERGGSGGAVGDGGRAVGRAKGEGGGGSTTGATSTGGVGVANGGGSAGDVATAGSVVVGDAVGASVDVGGSADVIDSGANSRRGRVITTVKKGVSPLSAEERRAIRARRNRESAEKSRVRRKQQTNELERSVGELRYENRELKERVVGFERELTAIAAEGDPACRGPPVVAAVNGSLAAVERCMAECPRTFRKEPHSPEIELKYKR